MTDGGAACAAEGFRTVDAARGIFPNIIKDFSLKKGIRIMKIAIDGPSGAGKSTLAKALARRLSLVYVDTGAMYRTVGLCAARAGVDPHCEDRVKPLLADCEISLKYEDDGQHVYLCGEDVSGEIRTPEASKYASAVSALPAVRSFLLGVQRDMADKGGVIMDGRDIGTVIMPDADCKLFVFASAEARARRRFKELREKGQECTLEEVLRDIEERDRNDREREIAPCVPAEDAVMFDNSELDFDGTVEEALRIIREKTE